MFAGLILIAAATSLPELAVSVSAAKLQLPDLATGGLFGSNLMNLLILGLIDFFIRSKGRLLSRASAAHAVSGCMSIGLMAILAGAIIYKPQNTWLGAGYVSFFVLIIYLLGIRIVYYDQIFCLKIKPNAFHPRPLKIRPSKALLGYLTCAGAILVTAPYLASSCGKLIHHFGFSETFIGTSLVALITSLPELITTIAALRLGSSEMAVGNVFGSNSFNMAIIGISDFFFEGALLTKVSVSHVLTALCGIFITITVLIGQLYHSEKRIAFIEPDAAIVIILVIASLGLIYNIG